ncbi:hypothetical protein PENSPDRAFT_612548 [Peniophora sp. CONT]|nr:hypothetical protein PENSPDRAFT_612548 [Peniophora sp. CONT]
MSFANFASQYLQRQRAQGAGTSTLAASHSQPLFYSFSTEEGGNHSRAHHDAEHELDDVDDPHMRASTSDDGLGNEVGASSSRGWLAHQPTVLRSPSDSSEQTSMGSDSPPPDIFQTQRPAQKAPIHSPEPPPPPPRSLAVDLTESLLPRDASRPRSLFSLPDPRFPAPRRKYHDATYTTAFFAAVSTIYVFCIVLLFVTASNPRRRVYTTLLHTIPLLAIVTFLSALVSYAHILLLRLFAKPVILATSVFVPLALLLSALWAFVGSFIWDPAVPPTWGETWGLRIFSLIPLVLAIITGRRLIHLPAHINSTSGLLTLTTRVLAIQPVLLLLSPTVLLAFLLGSIPFLTLAFRLLLIGYTTSQPSGIEYHVAAWADWAIVGVASVWVWAWGVARGLCRVTTAGVVAAWYFADPEAPPPPPQSTHTLHAALHRATHPSLGTICLSALLLALVRMATGASYALRRLPSYLPLPLQIYAGPVIYGAQVAAGALEAWAGRFGRYVLVYVGVTGEGFWPSVGRAGGLTTVERRREGEAWRRKFRTEPPLTLLTITPLTCTLPFALGTYLFVAHTLRAPDFALEAALLAGTATALVGLFCVGMVKDAADTLYLCYTIDREAGERRAGREEVAAMFDAAPQRVQQRAASRVSNPAQRPPPPTEERRASAPISRRVEGIESPMASPPNQHRSPQQQQRYEDQYPAVEEEEEGDIDPFLRADTPESEAGADVPGYNLGGSGGKVLYDAGADSDDSVSVASDRDRDRSVVTGRVEASRVGRDAEEGLGGSLGRSGMSQSEGLGGMFPGSDLF